MNTGKKEKIWIFAIAITIILTAGIIIGPKYISGKKNRTYIEINIEELKTKLEKKDSFILFIGAKWCPHCQDFKITANKIVNDYEIDIYHIDIADMEEEDKNFLKVALKFSGSLPTTISIVDGEEYNRTSTRIEGALPYKETVSRLKKAGFIKE